MIQGLLRSTTLPALEQTAVFAERRHEILAGNIANVDTPGYRSRDLSVENFQNSLAAAIQSQQSAAAKPFTSPGESPSFGSFPSHTLSPSGALSTSGALSASGSPPSTSHLPSDPMDGPRRAMEKLVYHDGSDVNLERQVTEVSKNQSLHNTAIALMRSQFNVLRAAISERV